MRTHTILRTVLLLFLAATVTSVTANASGPTTNNPLQVTEEAPPASFVHRLVERVNNERAQNGLLPLKLSDSLVKAAENQAQAMAANHYLESRTPDGKNANFYAYQEGFPGMTGQSLYRGKLDLPMVLSLWLSDPTNHDNLLNPECDHIGGGLAVSDDRYGTYLVLEMGHLTDGYPVVINREAEAVAGSKVTLSLYGAGKIEKMRFSNDGVTFTEWEPFQPSREWILPAGAGKRSVFVELSDGIRIYSSQDSIIVRPVLSAVGG